MSSTATIAMKHPYQCVAFCDRSGSEIPGSGFFFAASGPKILSFSRGSERSRVISVWPQAEESVSEEAQENTDGEPRGKKRKIDDSTRPKDCKVTKLCISTDGTHLIAVTGEDKCVRVFEISPKGELKELSQRCMPKRPSAIALTDDGKTILVGDKFGDVYSLPLIQPKEDFEAKESPAPAKKEEPKVFKPAASHLTVHSKRNLQALEAQLKQQPNPKTKEPLKFTHKLLLGHVSMLTDMAFVVIPNAENPKAPRKYILTGDRDEHIRVSRAPPQAHIIEGFCLGHEAFISKLAPVGNTGLLLSAGGDDYVYRWKFQTGELEYQYGIAEAARGFLQSSAQLAQKAESEEGEFNIAVSGLWVVPHSDAKRIEFLVACEGIPALFHVDHSLDEAERSVELKPISLDGNPLDVAIVAGEGDHAEFIASIDNVHEPGSTSARRSEETAPKRLQRFIRGPQQGQGWTAAADGETSLETPNQLETVEEEEEGKGLGEFLYATGILRKRPGSEE